MEKDAEKENDRKKMLAQAAEDAEQRERDRQRKKNQAEAEKRFLDEAQKRRANKPKEGPSPGDGKLGNGYDAMKDKLGKNNQNIYGNALKFNSAFGNPLNPNIFNAKDDDEFNRLMAEQKKREKNRRPDDFGEAQKANQEYQDDLRKQKEDAKNRKKLYKDYLDNQTQLNKMNRAQPYDDDGNQLIMPSYYYPNLPECVHHRARDSINASKNPEEYFGKDMGKFFKGDAQAKTLIDYEGDGDYLWESRLRHNPITCPVNDYYYNKYVNKMKRDCEYIPERDGVIPENLINNRDGAAYYPNNSLANNGQKVIN